MPKKFLFAAVTIAVALRIGAEAWRIRQTGQQIAAENHRLAQLEGRIKTAQDRLDTSRTEKLATAEKLAALQAAATAKDAREALAKSLDARIKILRQRLDAMPGEKILELKMLGMIDWIDAALSEATTDSQLKVLFLSLRSKARSKFAGKLHEALERFVEVSGGELPASASDLLPYLTPPADADMLVRYAMRRSGKTGARDEELIGLKSPDKDGTVSIRLNGYSSDANSEYEAHLNDAVGATEMADNSGATSDVFTKAETEATEATMKIIDSMIDKALASLDMDTFKTHLKAAIKQFSDANPGQTPSDLFQLRAYFLEAEHLAELIAPIFAQYRYLLDHEGKPPQDPAQLQHILEKPVDASNTLSAIKFIVTDDEVSLNFVLKTN